MRTEYKDSDNGEQLRMCSVTGVCNEGKMSPAEREMVTPGCKREEHRPGLQTGDRNSYSTVSITMIYHLNFFIYCIKLLIYLLNALNFSTSSIYLLYLSGKNLKSYFYW